MPRPVSQVLTARESEIMRVLWEGGEANSEQIGEQLKGRPHDSSVRTMLRVLVDKGYVRVRSARPRLYRAAVPQAKVQTKVAKNLLQSFFSGSAEALVLRLLEDDQLTVEELDQLRKTARRKGKLK